MFLMRSDGAGVGDGARVGEGVGVSVDDGWTVAVKVAPGLGGAVDVPVGRGAGERARGAHPVRRPAPVSSESRKKSRRESRLDLFTAPMSRLTDDARVASL